MKKALVLGVMAIFAISMNLNAQDRSATTPQKENKAKPAATSTIKKETTVKDDAKKVEIKNEEHKKVENKAVDPKGNNDAKPATVTSP